MQFQRGEYPVELEAIIDLVPIDHALQKQY